MNFKNPEMREKVRKQVIAIMQSHNGYIYCIECGNEMAAQFVRELRLIMPVCLDCRNKDSNPFWKG